MLTTGNKEFKIRHPRTSRYGEETTPPKVRKPFLNNVMNDYTSVYRIHLCSYYFHTTVNERDDDKANRHDIKYTH